jgi:hypothetical protein
MTDGDDVGGETVIGVGAVGPQRARDDLDDATTIDESSDDARPTGKIERPRRAASPVRVISMKTPAAEAPEKLARRKPEVKLAPPGPVVVPATPRGRLAPPRDTREVRVRRVRDVIVRGGVAVLVAAVVALVIWLIAGR